MARPGARLRDEAEGTQPARPQGRQGPRPLPPHARPSRAHEPRGAAKRGPGTAFIRCSHVGHGLAPPPPGALTHRPRAAAAPPAAPPPARERARRRTAHAPRGVCTQQRGAFPALRCPHPRGSAEGAGGGAGGGDKGAGSSRALENKELVIMKKGQILVTNHFFLLKTQNHRNSGTQPPRTRKQYHSVQ